MMLTLRDYQKQAVDNIIHGWEAGQKNLLLTCATGGGKTAIFLAALDQVLSEGGRALVLAHRKELIEQPRDRMIQYFPDWQGRIGIVMAEQDECGLPLTIATVQTLASERRLARLLEAGAMDYLVTDECFPAGTLVDGRPIETLRPGDEVTAWDESGKRLMIGKVIRVMRRAAPSRLVKLRAGNHQIVCTGNHPVLGSYGWIPAEEVTKNDTLGLVQNRVDMFTVRENVSPAGLQSVCELSPLRERLLFGRLPSRAVIRNDVKNEPAICQRSDENQQPNEQPDVAGENASDDKGDVQEWVFGNAAGEWALHDSSENACGCVGMGDGSCYPNGTQRAGGFGDTGELQGGYRQFRVPDCYRSGWKRPQTQSQAGRGHQEDSSVVFAGVDSVEVLERGSDREFERLCPDGYVYNLEVENFHTYVANGIIVHNCHHATSASYLAVYEQLRAANPDLRHLGVTATPVRADGDGLSKVYEAEAGHYGIVELIGAGYLVPVRWLAIQVRISLKDVKSANGDFVARQLADVFETGNCFDLVVKSHQEYAAGRQAVAFTVSVEGAYRLAEAFRAAGIAAEAADGTTNPRERARILNAFRRGETQVLCNVGLYTEGLDIPEVSCVHQVRPTKSDALYTQMIGRALRTYPGKEDALILDFCPLEARNIAMAGDVLGVPLRRESYVREPREDRDGEVLGGFTFDGKYKWLEGNPAEIISRQLDYLQVSPYRWYRAEDGSMSLGLGKGSDEIERTLVISKPGEGDLQMYLVAKRPGSWQWQAWLVQEGAFEALSVWADAYAAKRGNAVLATKARSWLKEAPREEQIKYARRLRVYRDGLSRGELAARMTHALAIRALGGGL